MNGVAGRREKAWIERLAAGDLSRARYAIALVAICAVALAVHLPLLDGTFIAVDDGKQIVHSPVVHDLSCQSIEKTLWGNYLNRNHAPMYTSFVLNWALSPGSYTGFAVFNLFCLLVITVIFSRFAALFLADRVSQLAATALFAVHMVHVDVVAWMSARCHLMGMPFFLLAFVAWRRYREDPGALRRAAWYGGALLAAWIAIWNKNIFFTVGPLLILFDIYRRRRLSAVAVLDKIPLLAMGAVPIYILQTSTSYLGRIENPALGDTLITTLLNDANLLVQYLINLLVPLPTYIWVNVYGLSGPLDVSQGAGLAAMRIAPLAAIGILVAVALLLVWAARRFGLGLPLFAAAASLIALAPVMNIPPRWVEFAFRYDWIPSAFACPAIVAILARWWRGSGRASWRWLAFASLLGLIGWHGVGSHLQARAWTSERRLLERCVESFDDAMQCHTGLAGILRRRGELEEAEALGRKMDSLVTRENPRRTLRPDYGLARTYEKMGRWEEAAFYYRRALLRESLRDNRRSLARRRMNAALRRISEDEAEKPDADPERGADGGG
ncbi:MAG: hypothetical protein R6V85_06670 [Polyangia bacterium]